MTRTEFALMVYEMLNEYDCKMIRIEYYDDGVCCINYTNGDYDSHFYAPYRFMNRARLRLLIMEQLNLLIEINPLIDLGF